ncbi:MAG: type I pullulanase [Clostridiales bacterium]|nr:type I pullulanase [Clostridiales bacterium]
MKNFIKTSALRIKQFALLVLAAAIAIIAMPLGLLGSRKASAEVSTGEYDSDKQPTVSTSADGDYELTLNYFRKNENYEGWNLWAWAPGADGAQYDPTTTVIEGKTWITFKVTMTGITPDDFAIGFIVRRSEAGNAWAQKAVDADIKVPADEFDEDGKATIYMADNIDERYTNAEDAMNHKVILRVTAAYFQSPTKVRAVFNKTATAASLFKLKDADDNVLATVGPMADGETYKEGVNFRPDNSSYIVFDLGADFEVDYNGTYTVCDEPESGEFDPEKNYPTRKVNIYSLYDNAAFGEKYNYEGELGARWTQDKTDFTVWAPVATEVKVAIYDLGEGGDATEYPMTKGTKGEWTATVSGNLNKMYYTYKVTNGGKVSEVVDPYARSGGKNGLRGQILDLDSTDPEGWNDSTKHKIPDYGTTANNLAQAVIWEAQLRDLTINENSGVSAANRGKFLGLTETASDANGNKMTPLDYLKSLGVTQVHFQPLFDFASVDESFTQATYQSDYEDLPRQYNWGYDPLNYNMPEGSYSSNPSKGELRVNEMKQMIMALHNAGIQVVMDVVYNHVSGADESNFEQLMPGYYFRRDNSGNLYNGSGCGNETASDRYMFHRFMVDSCKYWMEEYKIDGFRFDLMGLHDIDTMNEIYDTLEEINKDVIIYGEGWTGGTSGLTGTKAALIANAKKTPNIAYFDDVIRDALKGSVFDVLDTGYASGKAGMDAAVYVGAAGATNALSGVYYSSISKSSFAGSPVQNINYVSCHDNSSLWDKLNASVNADKATLQAMNRVAATSVLTSQGAAFMLAGEEMLRSKPTTETNDYSNNAAAYLTDETYFFSGNSYMSPDSVNAIDWQLATDNKAMVDFYKELIAIKKTFPQFHLTTTAQIKANLFIRDNNTEDGIASYAVKDPASDNYAVVLFNMNDAAKTVKVPNGKYSVYVNGDKANASEALSTFSGSSFKVGAYSAVVMVAELKESTVEKWQSSTSDADDDDDGNLGLALGLGIGIPVAVLIAGGAVFGVMYSKKKKGNGKDETENNNEPEKSDEPEQPEQQPETEQPAAEETAPTENSENE